MELVTEFELPELLKESLGTVESCEQALNRMVSFYKQYKTQDDIQNTDQDMLLFQYGEAMTIDKAQQFEINITRQVASTVCYYMQVSVSLFYDLGAFGEKTCTLWSVDSNSVEDWMAVILNTEGFTQSKTTPLLSVETYVDHI